MQALRSHGFQIFRYLAIAFSLYESFECLSYNPCVFIGNQDTIHTVISQNTIVAKIVLAPCKAVLIGKLDVHADRMAFVLCYGRHHGKNEIGSRVIRADVLFLKDDRNSKGLKPFGVPLTVHHVAGKTGDAFTENWIRQVRTDLPDAPILVTAGGLFHYFEEDKVISLFRMLRQFGEIEVVFDTVNKKGMAMMQKKYMKQVGHADVQMFFYVDSAVNLAGKIGGGLMDMTEEPYYRYIPKNGLKLSTKVSMAVSDRFCMVKMICLNL